MRLREVQNIKSNLPSHWFAGTKPTSDIDRFATHLRGKRIELIEGYGEALGNEIEAQFEYWVHQHEKKSNPPVYYTAWHALLAARWAVYEYEHDANDATVFLAVQADLKQQEEAKYATPADAFKAWLVKETQLYYTALRHPERVLRWCSPDPEIYTKRYAVLSQVLHVCLTDGADAAYNLWKDELGNRFDAIHGSDTSTFQSLEGRSKYSGGKTGYWQHDESAMRPILVADPKTIQRNQEEIARTSAHKAHADRFDYEVELPVVEAPKRPRGRPKGVRNKPKPRPVSKEVAAWQAEADRKLGYSAE